MPTKDNDKLNDAFEDWFIESDASVNTLQEKRQLQDAFEAGANLAIEASAKVAEDMMTNHALAQKYAGCDDDSLVVGEEVAKSIAEKIRGLKDG